MTNKDKEKNTELWAKILTWVGFILVPMAILMPFMVIYFDLSSWGDYGTVGDFIGGTTVTFLTGASVFLLIATNIMQRKELQMSRQSVDEMVRQTEASVEQMKASVQQAEEARKETQITNETMKKQQFETTFFNMLSLHHQIVNDIHISVIEVEDRVYQTNKYDGREAFVKLKEILEDKLGKADYLCQNNQQHENAWNTIVDRKEWREQLFATTNRISEELLNNVYKNFHEEYGNAIGHYMRNNYRIVKFIVENVVDNEEEQKRIKEETKRDTIVGDKRFYFGTLRAQWSNAEFELIFINSLYERNSKFKSLIKQHDVLDIQETDEEALKGRQEGSFILKKETPIPVAYKHLIENN